MTVTRVIAQQSTENMEYVRKLLREKQPGFSAALESALKLLELEPWPAQMPAETTATRAAVRDSRQPGEALSPCRTPGAARQLRRLRVRRLFTAS
jgi:cell division septation protein DedD